MAVVAKSMGRVDERWRSATLLGGGKQVRLSVVDVMRAETCEMLVREVWSHDTAGC
jgi:hypothetical protein